MYFRQKMPIVGNTPFRPTMLAGLQHWLDASDASTITIASGSSISQWNDKSGNGRHCTQSTGSAQPTIELANQNGKNTVRFTSASSQMMDFSSSINANGDVTYFGVVKFVAATNAVELYDQSAVGTNYPCNLYTDTGKTFLYSKSNDAYLSVHTTPINIDPTAAYIYLTWRFADAGLGSSSFRVNATAGTLESFGGGTGSNIDLNRIGGRNTSKTNGWIAEQGVYNRLLSNEEITQLETYLKNKWGL